MQSLQQEKQQNSESNQQKSSAPYINEKRHIGVNNNNRTTPPPGTTTGATSRSQTSTTTTTTTAAASYPSINKSTTNSISTPFDSIAAAPQLVLSDSNSYNNSSTATMSQSDAHSVSSGFSNNSAVQQQTSIATSTVPPPIVQNPFESLSPAPKTSMGVPGVSSNLASNIPPTHVAIRMQQPTQHMVVQPTTIQSLPQSPMRVGPITNTARTSTSTPTQPVVGIGSQTQYKQSMPLASTSTGIPSPVSHPPTVTQSPQNFRPASDTSYNYPMFDSSSQQQTNVRPSNNYQMNNNNNDFIFDDDENTAPSSLGNATDEQSQQQQLDPSSSNYPTSISSNSLTSRIIESTKRLISTTTTPLNSDHTNPATTTTTTMSILTSQQNQQCLISGYLEKFGRNNKWQTRWFETNGIYLSYYKSSKRSKLLATLDLQKVGLIEIDTDDKTEHSFRIQVLGRLYQLRANSRASCQDWVITLNRIKEARMQQGNVKLVGMPTKSTTGTTSPMDLLNGPNTVGATSSVASTQQNPNNFLDGTPRVVVVSNRERTHGVDEEDQWDEMIRIDDGQNITLGGTTLNETDVDPASGHQQVETIYGNNKRLSSIGTVVAARWTKHHSTFQRLGNKLSKWARSIKKYSCIDADAVVTGGGPHHNTQQNYGDVVHLDKYLHPPGHDDKLNKQRQQQQHQHQQQRMKMQPPMATAGTHNSNIPMHTTPSMTVSSNVNSTTTAVTVNKPLPIVDRSISSTSDYDVRMLS